jgi:hypothetical protein
VHFGESGPQNINTLFFMLGWASTDSPKKRFGTRETKIVFLDPLGSVGHVAHPVCPGLKTLRHFLSCLGGPGAVSIKSS